LNETVPEFVAPGPSTMETWVVVVDGELALIKKARDAKANSHK